jgi:hypothetical protein
LEARVLRAENLETGKDLGMVSVPEAAAVRLQLANILESPHFRNSKRSRALLGFVVEGALDGRHDLMKERTIGVTVFGREADYDTAQDAIVRNAAVEVRKRLAQYYVDPEHAAELRIDLPLGSYVPVFTADPSPAAAPAPPLAQPRLRLLWPMLAATLLIAGGTIFWSQRRTAASELDAFWAPLLRSEEVIQICVGQPNKLYRFVGPRRPELDQLILARTGPAAAETANHSRLLIAPAELTWAANDYLYMRDAFSAARIAAWVQSKGSRYQMVSVSSATYSQLRRSPLVAIGAFDNPWAIRITSSLRFVFGHKTIDGAVYNCVIDRRNPDATNWMVAQAVGTGTPQDYAIVTRVFDSTTERTVVAVAGIENYGTLSAGEFVTTPEYLGRTLQTAAADWRQKNLQIVLGTKIIEGTPGPPKVLATYSW